MRKVLQLLIFVLTLWVGNLMAQVNFSVPTLETCGDTVSVPIAVTDFTNITAFSYSMHWDETILQFDSIGAFNLQHLDGPDFGTTQTGMGFYTAAWVDNDGSGESAANGTIIYRVYFTVLGGMGTSSTIEFNGTPTPIVVGSGFPPMSIPVTTTDGQVDVDDTVDPVISCPGNVLINTMNPSEVVNGIAPVSFSDNCMTPAVTYSTTGATVLAGNDDVSGSTFNSMPNSGVTTVTYMATDLKGNTGTCSFTVTINQVIADLLVTAVSDTAFCQDSVLAIDIEVNNFSNVSALSFSITWDEMVIRYDSIKNFNLQHLDIGDFGLSQTSMGIITFAWIDDDGSGETVPNGDSIFTIYFTTLTDVTDASDISFSNIPTSIVAGQGFPPMSIPILTNNGVGAKVDDPPVINGCPANMTMSNDPGICGKVVSWTLPTVDDDCDNPDPALVQTSMLGDGDTFPVGITTVSYSATDSKSQTTTCSFTITINDTENPVAVCPASIADVELDATGNGTLPANIGDGGSTDNCSVTETSPSQSYTCTDLGAQTVTLTATDGSGNTNTASCSFNVVDNIDPATVCPASITDVELDASGNGTLPANIGDGSSTDNCTVTETSPSQSYTCVDLGGQTVTLTATDGSGNTNTASCSFNVVDNIDPVAICPATIADVVLDGSGNGTLPANIGDGSSTDNCSVASETSPSQSYTCADLGAQTVTLTATDGSGNTNTASCSFNVVDNIDPVAICPATIADVVLDGSGNGTLPANIGDGSSTDNCSVTETSPSQSYTCTDLGVQTVTLTATDGSGNIGTATCSFNVVDNEAPVAICPATIADVVLDGSGNGTLPANIGDGSSTDNCTVAETSPSQSYTCSDLGVQTVTLTATDGSVNSNTETCSFNVFDNEVQTAICPATIVDVVLDGSGNGTLPANIGDGSSTDNCSVASETSPSQSYTCADLGVQTVTLTATDGSGNSGTATCSFNVVDNEVPVAICPASIADVVLDGSGNGTLPANIGDGSSTDNCSVTETSPSQSYTCADLGVQTVTLTATDGSGNSDTETCSFNVVDNEVPTAICPATIADVVLDGSGNGTLPANIGDGSSTDNCSVASETSPSQSYTCSDLGVQTVTLTATDGSGNIGTATCSFNVVDNEAPVAICPVTIADVVLDANGDGTLAANIGDGSSTDNCSVTETSPLHSYTCSDLGVQTVTLTATDGSGNSDTETCSFNVVDTTPPTITCPANQTVSIDANCEAIITDYTVMTTVSDNCTAIANITIVQSPIAGTVVTADTDMTMTATDEEGNASSCTFKVILDDSELPVVTCPGNQTLNADANCEATLPDYAGLVTATDNCPGLSLIQVPVIATVINTTTTVTFTATDAAGNMADCSFDVSIIDVTPPIITTCAPDDVLLADGNCEATLPNYTGLVVFSDNCDAVGDIKITQVPADGVVINSDTTVYIIIEDLSGNKDSCSFMVAFDDNTSPTITCPTNISVGTESDICTAVVTWTTIVSDNCDPDPMMTCVPPSGTVFPVGDSTVTCTVEDLSGNTNMCQFLVTVSDNQTPTLVCPSDTMFLVTIAIIDTVVNNISLVSSADNCGIDTTYYHLTGATTGEGADDASGAAFAPGTTLVTYYVEDAAGNIDSCSFNVIILQNIIIDLDCSLSITQNIDAGECAAVINTAAPGIDPIAGLDTIYYELTDATTGSGADSIPDTQVFNIGTTTATYTAISITNDTSTCSFTVTVVDNEAPSITCPGAMTVDNTADSCGIIFINDFMATATDNCPGVIVDCGFSVGDLVPVGINTITCTATDAAGNTASCSYQLTVQDTEPPVIVNCPVDINVNTDPSVCGAIVTWQEPTATDNCAVLVLESSPLVSGDLFPAETTPVTYTAVDAVGNVTECTFNVKVSDNEPPSLNPCPGNITVNNDPGLCSAQVSWPFINPADNCGVISFIVLPMPNSVFPVGATQVQAAATDAAGNVTVCSFNVTVIDSEFPTMTGVPTTIIVNADPNECGAIVNWSPILTDDNCGVDTFYCDASSGDFFVVGMHTVTCTAVDENGNGAVQDFIVIVQDDEIPDVDCPENITIYVDGSIVDDPSGFIAGIQPTACDSLALDYNPMPAVDNCGIASIIQTGGPPTGSTISAGMHTLTYLITDMNGNQVTCGFNIEIVEIPNAIADAFPINPCEGEDVLFFTDDYANATYEWVDPMGNIISNAFSFTKPALSQDMTGTYNVTITFPFNCVLTASVDVEVFANPEVIIEYNDLVCTDGSIPLVLEAIDTVNAGVVDCVWELPDGTFAFGETLTIINATSSNSGVYTVLCTTANGCVSEVSRNVIINDEPPQPDLTGDKTEACIGESIALDGEEFAGPNIDYHWTAMPMIGSGLIDINNHDNAANPSLPGTYIYKYIITQGNCVSDTAEWVVVVQEDPAFSLGVDGQVDCVDGGSNIDISAVTSTAGLVWNINVNGNCTPVQNDSTFTLNNVTADCSGLYEVTATSSIGCSTTETVNLSITDKPVTPLLETTDSVICMGGSTTIFSQNIPLGVSFEWTVNGTIDPTFPGLPIIVSPTATTTYGLQIITADGCVSDMSTVEVTVELPLPIGIIVDGDVDCVDGTTEVTLIANVSGGDTFVWDGPCGVQSGNNLPIPNIVASCSGLYSVSVTGTLGQCINIGTLQLEVTGMLSPVTAELLSSACDGGDLEFCAEPAMPGATYTWRDPAGNIFSNDRCPVTPAILNGAYTVTADIDGCTASNDTVVTIITEPIAKDDFVIGVVDAPQSFNVVVNDVLANDDYTITVVQQPSNGNVSYNGEGVFTYNPQSGFRETDIMAYEICYKDCPELCDIALVTIEVRYPPDQCIATTVITPNNDGINDQFVISCLEVDACPNNQLIIYNQWGDKVFEAAPYDNTWKGTYNGRDVPDGTYFFVFRCDNSSEPEKGFVMVYR